MTYFLMTFESTHEAIKTEKALAGLDIDMIPTPRQLSTNCGLSLKANIEDMDTIRDLLGPNFGGHTSYIVEQEGKLLTFKKVQD